MLDQVHSQTEQIDFIEQLISIGTALFTSNSLEELLNLILTKSREITCSDAGSIYLVDQSDDVLKLLFEVSQNASKPALSLREFAIPMTMNSLAGYVALTGALVNWPDVYDLPPDLPYQLDRSFDYNIAYRTRSVLALPMQNAKQQTIGVLQLINRKVIPDAEITPENALEITQPYSPAEERLVQALAHQAAIAIELKQLQKQVQQLKQHRKEQDALDSNQSSSSPIPLLYLMGLLQNQLPCLLNNLESSPVKLLSLDQFRWSLSKVGAGTSSPTQSSPGQLNIQYKVSPSQGFFVSPPDQVNGQVSSVFLNDQPLVDQQPLQAGDRIQLGDTIIHFLLGELPDTLSN